MVQKKEIKQLILDVDGVILGSNTEVNFPYPSKRVVEKIQQVTKRGVKISLCTGKPSFAVKILMEHIPLDTFHVSDGGAVIFNPFTHEYLEKNIIDPAVVNSILNIPIKMLESWQVYTLDSKYIDESKFNPKTVEDARIMPWIGTADLVRETEDKEVTKLELLYPPEVEENLHRELDKFTDSIDVQWTHTPLLLPNMITIITCKNINKKASVKHLLGHIKVGRDEVLAVGDTMSDWKFMEGSGRVATLANASAEMQSLVLENGGFVGRHVNEDGLLDILEYYGF